ncbi:MAG: cadherin-like beta sandwich domain-containing protein [Oscillospiraceae bacterium]|nr:cadherin-like beta sandwich domain-containing protein [Oscillospiraceae bacterium]
MRKKIVSLFSAAALFITLVCTAFVNVSAAGAVKVTAATDLASVKQGGTVRVDLNLTDNPGLISIHLKVNYDPDVFEFSKAEDKKLFGTTPTYLTADDEGCYRLNWLDYQTEANHTQTGLLASVYFKVKNTAEDGNYEFTIGAIEDDVTDFDLNPLPISFENASVKVNDGRSDDATLKSLVLSNKNVSLNPAFDPDTEDYTVLLPNGSKVPTVTATKNDAKAKVQTTQAKSFNTGENVATIVVTAEKGNTKTYTVTFTEMNALLSSLKVNGTSVTGFDSNKTSYTYEVSYADWKADSAKTYTIDATASKEDSTVEIAENDFALTSTDPTKNTDKNATVTVTSAQGDTTTYTIKFTVLACVHDYQINEAGSTPAACTAAGENLYVCSICGGEKTETVNALGHDKNSEWTVVDARCETDGSRTQICSRCGETMKTTVLKAKGHKWSKWTNIEGTGDYTRTCANANCEIGTQTRTVGIAEDGHIHDHTITEVVKPATCTENGEQRTWCSVEGCASFIPDEIAMIDHTPRIEREEPTCTTEGAQREVCIVCGHESEWEVIDALGHDFAEAWTTDENDHWHACTRCDADDAREAHTENEGVVTTPATTVSNGIKTYSCTVCEKPMRTEVLPMIVDNTTPSAGRPTEIYVGAPIIPFGGVSNESMSVKVENAITGKTSTARAQRNGNSVSVKLGAENNGYYANVFTTDDEYIYSAVIEGGKAEFNAPSDVKIKIVIDSIAYGEDVSSAAAADIESTEISSDNTTIYLVSVVLLAGAAVMTVFIKKRTNK